MLNKLFCCNPTSQLKSFQSYCTKLSRNDNQSLVRSASALVNRCYCKDEPKITGNSANAHVNVMRSVSVVDSQCYKTRPITGLLPISSNLCFRSTVPFVSVSPWLSNRSFSSSSGGKVDNPGVPEVSAVSGGSNVDVGNSGVSGSEWIDKVKDAWQGAVDAITYSAQKAKEASHELTPYVQQLLDSHPYLKNVGVSVGWTLTGTVVAWFVMPRVLRRFHKYSMQTPAALLSGSVSGQELPYEKSIWGALEDPLRYLITFMAFSQVLVLPTRIFASF